MKVSVDPDVVRRYVDLTQRRNAIEKEIAELRAQIEGEVMAAFSGHSFDLAAPWPTALINEGPLVATYSRSCQFDPVMVLPVLQARKDLASICTVAGPKLAKFLWSHPALEREVRDHVRYHASVGLRVGAGKPEAPPG